MAQSHKQVNKFALKKKELEIAHNEMEEMYEKELKRIENSAINQARKKPKHRKLKFRHRSATEEKFMQLQSNYELLGKQRKKEVEIIEEKLKSSEGREKEKESMITSYQLQLKQCKTESQSQSSRLLIVSKELEKYKKREKEARDGMNNLLYHNKERDAYFKDIMAMNEKIMAENKTNQAEIAETRNMQVRYFQAIDEKTRANEEMWEKVNVYKDELSKAIECSNEATRQLQLAKKELDQRHKRLTDMEKTIKSLKHDLQTSEKTGITDLGDSKRPVKIGEMYGELFDNEWTDAMEVTDTVKKHFHGKRSSEIEEIIIHHLHRILRTCYEGCVQIAKKQLEDIAAILGMKLSADKVNDAELNKLQGIMPHRSKIAGDFAKQLAARKAFCDSMLNDWDYLYKNEDIMNELTTCTFYVKCLEICWYMVIQNPVMFLDDEIPSGTPMNKDIYREFTKSGDKVVYVVWPALFLHKDGPVLYKGVLLVK